MLKLGLGLGASPISVSRSGKNDACEILLVRLEQNVE